MKNYVFRSLPLNRDSRTGRYGSLINESDIIFNTWEDKYEGSTNIEKLKLGRNRITKLISYPLYLFYLFLFSALKVEKKSRIICMDLDTFIPVFLGGFWKGNIIYLDIVDPIGQTKFSRLPFNIIFDYLEYYSLKYRKYNILPNNNRVDYYKDRLGVSGTNLSFLLVENVPKLDATKLSNIKPVYDVGYFGTLDLARGIIPLVDYCCKKNLGLLIGGMGLLDEVIKEYARHNKNIKYVGAYTPSDLALLCSKVNFIWAYYSNNVFLHKYASPNKYYEHLAYKKPLIINEYVPISKLINDNCTGIVIEDSLSNDTFTLLEKNMSVFEHSRSDFTDWDNKYQDYSVDFCNFEKTSSY